MNLFKFLKRDKPKAEAPTPVPEGPKPATRRWDLTVPAGHVMPLGEPITQPFKITVEAGVRWHPEWEEPRITVNVWRFFPMGDAVGWAGPKALAFQTLFPEAEVINLAHYHGKTLAEGGHVVEESLRRLGVEAPKVQQLLSDFIPFRQATKEG